MAKAWQRLYKNTYTIQELLWLKHEYLESLIMGKAKVSYDKAHSIVNKIYNWEDSLR